MGRMLSKDFSPRALFLGVGKGLCGSLSVCSLSPLLPHGLRPGGGGRFLGLIPANGSVSPSGGGVVGGWGRLLYHLLCCP